MDFRLQKEKYDELRLAKGIQDQHYLELYGYRYILQNVMNGYVEKISKILGFFERILQEEHGKISIKDDKSAKQKNDSMHNKCTFWSEEMLAFWHLEDSTIHKAKGQLVNYYDNKFCNFE